MRKTRIICTIGPAVDSDEMVEALIENGMNAARLNFSHGSHEEQKKKADVVKKVREELDLPVALLLDTKGPEIRTGMLENGKIELKKGQSFVLTTEDVLGNEGIVSISYKDLVKDVKPGDSILIDDGLIGMKVSKVTDKEILCVVENGGTVSNKKGINVPGVNLTMPFVSPKDYEDILPCLFTDQLLENLRQYIQRYLDANAHRDPVFWFTLDGFFWFPRTLFGIENHLYAFYDYPELMHRINRDLCEFHHLQK